MKADSAQNFPTSQTRLGDLFDHTFGYNYFLRHTLITLTTLDRLLQQINFHLQILIHLLEMKRVANFEIELSLQLFILLIQILDLVFDLVDLGADIIKHF